MSGNDEKGIAEEEVQKEIVKVDVVAKGKGATDNFKDAINMIRKKVKHVIRPRKSELNVIPTGSFVIDHLTGIGGLPRGRLVEIYGRESSGKSTLSYHICAQVQRLGGMCLFLDFEHTFLESYAESLGVDLDNNFCVLQPMCIEDGEAIIDSFMATNTVPHLIVCDSVAAMIPKKELEGEGEIKDKGLQSRLIARFINKATKFANLNDVLMLVTNQIRSRIKFDKYDHGPDTYRPGGNALRFYISISILLEVVKNEKKELVNPISGEKEFIPVRNLVRATIDKNKLAVPHKKGEFYIEYGGGINNGMTAFGFAVLQKKVEMNSQGYWRITLPDGTESKGRGKEALFTVFNSNKTIVDYYTDLAKEALDERNKITVVQSGIKGDLMDEEED